MKIPDHYMAFVNGEEWRAWLEEHHTTEQEAWLLIRRKGAARQFLMLEEAIEEALCFGWIDGVLKPKDKESYALRMPGSLSKSGRLLRKSSTFTGWRVQKGLRPERSGFK